MTMKDLYNIGPKHSEGVEPSADCNMETVSKNMIKHVGEFQVVSKDNYENIISMLTIMR